MFRKVNKFSKFYLFLILLLYMVETDEIVVQILLIINYIILGAWRISACVLPLKAALEVAAPVVAVQQRLPPH